MKKGCDTCKYKTKDGCNNDNDCNLDFSGWKPIKEEIRKQAQISNKKSLYLNTRITPSLAQRIANEAKEWGVTKSKLIITILENYLNEDN